MKTEIVWAIGKSPDFLAHATLEALEHQVWTTRSDEPELQKLREAIDWRSIREARQGTYRRLRLVQHHPFRTRLLVKIEDSNFDDLPSAMALNGQPLSVVHFLPTQKSDYLL